MRRIFIAFVALFSVALFTAQTTVLPKTTILPKTTVLSAAVAGEPVFTDIQGLFGADTSSGTTLAVTLTTNPVSGNMVACEVAVFPHGTTVAVQDGNANAYTKTPNSPSGVQASSLDVFIFYLLNAPANANKVITATITGGPITFHSVIGCEEFHRASGSWTFDTDVAGNGSSTATINLPSITASVAGEVEFLTAYSESGFNSGPCNSPWTTATMNINTSQNDSACYILSATGSATLANMTPIDAVHSWNSMAAAFK